MITTRSFGQVTGLPSVCARIERGSWPRWRIRLDTGPTAVRNDAGHIQAVTRLVAA